MSAVVKLWKVLSDETGKWFKLLWLWKQDFKDYR